MQKRVSPGSGCHQEQLSDTGCMSWRPGLPAGRSSREENAPRPVRGSAMTQAACRRPPCKPCRPYPAEQRKKEQFTSHHFACRSLCRVSASDWQYAVFFLVLDPILIWCTRGQDFLECKNFVVNKTKKMTWLLWLNWSHSVDYCKWWPAVSSQHCLHFSVIHKAKNLEKHWFKKSNVICMIRG